MPFVSATANGITVIAQRPNVKRRLCRAVAQPAQSLRFSITKPAWAYSSRYIQAIARKCGICQVKRIPNKIQAPASSDGCTAVQPITGGIAPDTAPTTVQKEVLRFSGV